MGKNTKTDWSWFRAMREHNSPSTTLLPEYWFMKNYHRRCPMCEGYGENMYTDSHMECRTCDGMGRVNERGWLIATIEKLRCQELELRGEIEWLRWERPEAPDTPQKINRLLDQQHGVLARITNLQAELDKVLVQL
jgi:hypothetical protein